MVHRQGPAEIGILEYQICDRCRLGFVAKISIDVEFHGQGLGTRAIELARLQAPGYRWFTSGQDRPAKTFWERIARRTGDGYFEEKEWLHPCEHMEHDSRVW